jgi:hypothetical protein
VPLELGDRVATGTRVVVEGLDGSFVVEVRRTMWTLVDTPDPATEDDHLIVEETRSDWLPLARRRQGAALPKLGNPARPSPKRLRAALQKRVGRVEAPPDQQAPLNVWFHEAAWELRIVKVHEGTRTVVKSVAIRNTFGC